VVLKKIKHLLLIDNHGSQFFEKPNNRPQIHLLIAGSFLRTTGSLGFWKYPGPVVV
jgi:hypothetical protein